MGGWDPDMKFFMLTIHTETMKYVAIIDKFDSCAISCPLSIKYFHSYNRITLNTDNAK